MEDEAPGPLSQAADHTFQTDEARRAVVAVHHEILERWFSFNVQDLGIPIEGTRGPYGGYRLLPGYKLPPLLFTEDEAVALTLGLLGLRRSGLALAPEAVEGALAKVDRVLPAAVQARVEALQAHLALDRRPWDDTTDSALVVQLSEAAARGQSVLLRHQSQSGAETERVVDPYGVVSWTRLWYLVGYCHLRQGLRVFRLDRIADAAPHDARFEPPADFDCLGYVLRRMAGWGSVQAVEVVLGLSLEEARRKVPPEDTALEPAPDVVVLRTRATDLDRFARFLLGLGCTLAVHEPAALQEALQRVARDITRVADKV